MRPFRIPDKPQREDESGAAYPGPGDERGRVSLTLFSFFFYLFSFFCRAWTKDAGTRDEWKLEREIIETSEAPLWTWKWRQKKTKCKRLDWVAWRSLDVVLVVFLHKHFDDKTHIWRSSRRSWGSYQEAVLWPWWLFNSASGTEHSLNRTRLYISFELNFVNGGDEIVWEYRLFFLLWWQFNPSLETWTSLITLLNPVTSIFVLCKWLMWWWNHLRVPSFFFFFLTLVIS